MKRKKEILKKTNVRGNKNAFTTILIIIIIILLVILGLGVCMGYKAKAEINSLNSQISQLGIERDNAIAERDSLISNLSDLQKKYNLLNQDVQKIYKSCLTENTCKGHFPGVSWYCNNIGDEVNDPSHICVCDSSCTMKSTEI